MTITASMVKELRERTGAGMMECKKALAETNGDMEAAIELMRKSGAAKADKKAGRIAAEGQVVVALSDDATRAAMVEVNCETDFVAKDENFEKFANRVAEVVLSGAPADVSALMAQNMDGASVEETRAALIAKVGENVQVRRFERLEAAAGGTLGFYRHGNRIGVAVELEGGDAELAKDICMHIAASRPVCVDETQVPQELLDKEREIFAAQAAESGKPAEIIEKMVSGRIKKYLAEITLVGQPFVKDPDKTVGKLLEGAGAKVRRFVRYEVGEGIEKKTENFAEEVMAQAKGA
ncbi:translation elongation factor Ts [Thioalkalivibrio sulfidiphilus]|uniref:Elongation factor Ts n=1 Tax=Thioalkalivibrio sulfidiphilus (strain HL-EbGR7) TaxID=396588 RepID=EFTS_THISH|nr:translation elongation factor Ts [Thioalkalivibrio sulfidiphilus]B8GQ51.1 RecName: Full=Elongation factor Ts; Short=EF-Ts [Thioalkalivibrio sulfidiphilus HL-EbGr7]ACL72246.1 translation elongation factor Ts [Thioalkalivibrio sulfidiphilus HL-EbGr7]